ncbi:unnamed protein product [Didymodactylos carnosus]|uniref:Uncharacterized protein n=1 Tax=Didymodactylos carnosus TaxID=1234261 RepID=A0A8S2HYK4_9BILA|nr:unnamed protein product [Didymodactylos carnosus]CAF3694311.1 unnamed protein product [Didymodactylos carnosus]
MLDTGLNERRQDLFQTSAGVGHQYRPGYYFPSSNFKRVLTDPLPPKLACADEITPEQHFKSTNSLYFDNKYPQQEIYNDQIHHHRKAPAHWKIKAHGWNRSLTMANQKSEYKQEFDAKENMKYELDRIDRQLPYLTDETQPVTKVLLEDEKVRRAIPRSWDPSEQGVFNLLDPYLTTYNKEHRRWRKDEWQGIAKKDPVTYWDTEEYPKTWGFGNTPNHLPIDSVDREQLPMRDSSWFSQSAKIRQVHQPQRFIPHSGLTTETREQFVTPSHVNASEIKYCPLVTPFVQPYPSSPSAYCAPDMYKKESMNIGSGKPVTVTK